MSYDSEKDTLKRRIEALEQVVERLHEENQSCKTDIKRLRRDYDIMDSMGTGRSCDHVVGLTNCSD